MIYTNHSSLKVIEDWMVFLVRFSMAEYLENLQEGERKMEQMEKLRVLLPHWIEHNRGHAEECGKWSAFARHAGEETVAEAIDSAIALMNQASELLNKALLAAGGKLPENGHHHHHHH